MNLTDRVKNEIIRSYKSILHLYYYRSIVGQEYTEERLERMSEIMKNVRATKKWVPVPKRTENNVKNKENNNRDQSDSNDDGVTVDE